MEIEDQERNNFEKWLRSQPHVLNVGFNKSTQQYLLDEDQDMWVAWQARAELAIKYDSLIEDILSALRANSPADFIKRMIEETIHV